MSGHSKWSTIKHGKAVTDARRGKLFTKLTKEIIAAVRQSGGDPTANFRLRMAVQRAKDSNMPSNNIDRAIKRATGDGSGQDQMEEVVYEGYGPGGTAILLETLTDNKNRTVSDVRSTFTKTGGNLATAGAVAWQFAQKGVLVIETSDGESDDTALLAIDAGAEDFDADGSTIHAYTSGDKLEETREALIAGGASVKSFELSMIPVNTISLDGKTARQTLKLLDQLEEIDDVQKVYSNADFPDDVLDQYSSEN